MTYKLVFFESAVKDLEAIEKPYDKLIKRKIIQLSEDFESLENNVKVIKGKDNYYRLRVCKYRIIFIKDDDKVLIIIVRIGHRKSIYEK